MRLNFGKKYKNDKLVIPEKFQSENMSRGVSVSGGKRFAQSAFELQRRWYSERRRRKGDGTKTDIFEERSAASQEEYFRRETARQLQRLRDKEKTKGEDEKNSGDETKNKGKE